MSLVTSPNVSSLTKTGGTTVSGAVTVTAGTNITITQSGQDFSFASTGGMSIGGTVTSGTTGSVLFIGAGPVLAQDNAKFFWDDTNFRLGIGTSSPGASIDTTGAIIAGGNLTFRKDFAPTISQSTATTTPSDLTIIPATAGSSGTNGSNLVLNGGTYGGGLSNGGGVNITGGTGLTGGTVAILGGGGLGGGAVTIAGNSGASGAAGGSISISGGASSSSGAGGTVTINGGASTSGSIGNVILASAGVGRIGMGTTSPGAFLEIKEPAGTGAQEPSLLITAPAHTALTTGTEYVDVNLNLSRTIQWAGSTTLATQRSVLIGAPTLTFASNTNLTAAYTVEIGGCPSPSTGILNASTVAALNIVSGTVTTSTNAAIGIIVNAPTGALTTNAALVALGGGIGINTSTPKGLLDILVTSITSSANNIVCIDGTTRYTSMYVGGTVLTSLGGTNSSGFLLDFGWSPTANSAFSVLANQTFFTFQGTFNSTGSIQAFLSNTNFDSSGTASNVRAISAAVTTTAASSGNMTTTSVFRSVFSANGSGTHATVVLFDASGLNIAAGTITTAYGFRVPNPSITGTGAITNFTGLRLDDNTAAIGSTKLAIDIAGKYNSDYNGKITKYNNISTVSNGVPSEYATVDLTTQAAAISATTIYTPITTGMFRISVYLQVTRAASTSSILGGATGVVITYHDGDGNVAQTNTVALATTAGAIAVTSAGNSTATNLSGTLLIYANSSTAIQYAIGYTSVGGTTMQFAAHLKVEAL